MIKGPYWPGNRQISEVGGTKMAANLHFAVCAIYRQVIGQPRAEREAFDMATKVVCERDPGVRPVEARRRVAEMLCRHPPMSGITGENSFKFVTTEFSK